MSNIFGNKLKSLREEQQIPQRQLAAVLEIDTATYCKIEKGGRRAKREQIIELANSVQTNAKELLHLWSADKVYELIAEEDEATQILNEVMEVKYYADDYTFKTSNKSLKTLKSQINKKQLPEFENFFTELQSKIKNNVV